MSSKGHIHLRGHFWFDDRLDGLSNAAYRLYLRSISFASSQNTEGYVSKAALQALGAERAVADELIHDGLWINAHDDDDYDLGWDIVHFKEFVTCPEGCTD